MPLPSVTVHDKTFELFISDEQIQSKIAELGQRLSADFASKKPLLIGVLNGSFMFASDLMKSINIDAEITFIKVSSYSGMQSQGKTKAVTTAGATGRSSSIILLPGFARCTSPRLLQSISRLGISC